ncbi:recombination protein NinB [Ferrovum sp.]|uniref:recombination protein NinB n=1 Tax=Ferrovum sp. TaxID=2609467 RepID=UPI0026065F7A|nr:recombination protein NinB [Ferrovum sp.]
MRDKFQARKFLLRGPDQVRALVALISNLPIVPDKPLEVLIREEAKERKLTKNALYWVLLSELAEQAWLHGRQYSKDVWHEFCKKELMPNMISEGW